MNTQLEKVINTLKTSKMGMACGVSFIALTLIAGVVTAGLYATSSSLTDDSSKDLNKLMNTSEAKQLVGVGIQTFNALDIDPTLKASVQEASYEAIYDRVEKGYRAADTLINHLESVIEQNTRPDASMRDTPVVFKMYGENAVFFAADRAQYTPLRHLIARYDWNEHQGAWQGSSEGLYKGKVETPFIHSSQIVELRALLKEAGELPVRTTREESKHGRRLDREFYTMMAQDLEHQAAIDANWIKTYVLRELGAKLNPSKYKVAGSRALYASKDYATLKSQYSTSPEVVKRECIGCKFNKMFKKQFNKFEAESNEYNVMDELKRRGFPE